MRAEVPGKSQLGGTCYVMVRAREIVLPRPHRPILRNECLKENVAYKIQKTRFDEPQFVLGNNTFDALWSSGQLPAGSYLR